MKKKIKTAAIAGLLSVAVSGLAEGSLVLAEKGKSAAYSVRVAANVPTAVEAARELAKYVKRITDVELPVVEVPLSGSGSVRPLAKNIRLDVKPELGSEVFRFRTAGDDFVIEGGDAQALLFGVYDFLENECGCDWLTPEQEIVPRAERIRVPRDMDRVCRPAFSVRDCYYTEARKNPVFAAKLKLNERDVFDKMLWKAHTVLLLVPPDKYYKEHPEYYALVKGVRKKGPRMNLCLTNPDVLRIVTSNVLERIAKVYPKVKVFGVSQSDSGDHCECAGCAAIDKREGSPAGSNLAFVNAVADAVAEKYPDVIIETLAYDYTEKPPKYLKPRDNVMICLCTGSCDFSRPITESRYRPGGRDFIGDLRAWCAITKHVHIWDYTVNFFHMLHATPNVYSLKGNLELFKECGVTEVFEQGPLPSRYLPDAPLKLYLLGHLLWDPEQPLEPLLARFYKGYYGEAAPWMRRHMEELHAVSRSRDETKHPLKMWGVIDSPAMPTEVFERAARYLAKAAEAVKDDPVRSRNVRWEMNANDYTLIMRSGKPTPELKAAAARILEDWDAFPGYGRISEAKSVITEARHRLTSYAECAFPEAEKKAVKADSGTQAENALPGEPAVKPAIAPSPFPDVLSAYVWRNWFLVPKTRLAKTVSASPAQLTAVATEMGLPADPVVLPEWKRRGYITVLRRNWHLLPYSQLLELLEMTRDQLAFSLMEDDFLWVKLGMVKPKCGRLEYSPQAAAAGRDARRRIARILAEEKIDASAPEEPRFSFIRELSRPDPHWKPRRKTGNSAFDFRLIFSYFADYGDPLGDPEIGSFPEGLLQRLADQGVNAVWLHTVLRTLVKDPRYPEFGEGCENRIANLRKLVRRAEKYGIKVYLYMNEPRGLEPSFFKKKGRSDLGGAVYNELQAMCSSNPETLRWLSDSLARVFSSVKGLGGIFTISASENLTNCATRPGNKETCAKCRSRSRGEIIASVNKAMIEGMLRGDPKAEALVWNWEWPTSEYGSIVSALPKKNVRLMAVSEGLMEFTRGGVSSQVRDYSISVVGPGDAARKMWGLATENGLGAVAKVQVNCSWELSPFPYLPVMDLPAEHACNLAREGVRGVMLSWSLGCCPAPNLRLFRDLREGETSPDALLNRLARELYGAKAPRARKAWKAFSDGYREYPFHIAAVYNGPQQWGVANPLYMKRTGYTATMVGFPYDDLKRWRAVYPAEVWISQMDKVAKGFAEGCRLMEGVESRKENDMYRAQQMHFASCADQGRFVLARDRGDKVEMKAVARRELARAKAMIPIVRADSRIGYESSNHYFYTVPDLIEKVLSCRAVIDPN